jgi:putative DNA methylase
VDDPSSHPEKFPTEEAQQRERERLFDIIRLLMQKKLHERPEVYAAARAEMLKYCDGKLPPVLDPFAGGGSIPLEAARLGFEAHAADLNPVAVLLNKCNLELVPRWLDCPPVNPEARGEKREERGKAHALSGNDSLAEGDGGDEGTIPSDSQSAAGGNVRDALSTDAGGHLDPRQYRGGLDARVASGEGAVSGHCPGIAGGGRNAPDPLRRSQMVSARPDESPAHVVGRGEPHADNDAPQPSPNVASRSSLLFSRSYRGAEGLAADVRYYGRVVLERARKKIGHLDPKVHIVQEKDGSWRHATEEEIRSGKRSIREANVIAWLWARTVASPNPAAKGAHVPLVRSFWLSTKDKGKRACIVPSIDKDTAEYRFDVQVGTPPGDFDPGKGTVNRNGARCLLTGASIPFQYIRQEGKAGRLDYRLMAIVVELARGRTYVSPSQEHEQVGTVPLPAGGPDTDVPEKALGFRVQLYGMNKHYKMFTARQLTSLVTLSDLVREVRQDVLRDGRDAALSTRDAEEYTKAVATFLALGLDRCADFNNALCRWTAGNQKVMNLFGKQAIPMVWDFAEANFLGDCVGAWSTCANYVADCVDAIGGASPRKDGKGRQIDAASAWDDLRGVMVSTDPPYYDNIGYASLSDFFYIWLRRTIGDIDPDLFRTILVPKEPELTAAPERFDDDREKAREHFETGFRKAFTALREKMDERFPLTVYYAFKQEDEEAGADEDEAAEGRPANGVDLTTGWETLLEALLGSGFQITATWPVRASQKWRMVAMGTNALASYIVLACRPRPADAPQCSRREFLAALKRELPQALKHLQQGNIAPVDLAQASIGPGMAVFSRYARVVEASGNPMTVRTALALINQTLDEVLAEQEAEFDADTRWALAWFEQHGMEEGPFGDAETLSKAKNTAVNGLVEAGIVSARGGKVRLVQRDELPDDWDPASDARLTVWEITQHLIRSLENRGESGAAELLRKLGSRGETARELCYRLHKIAERRGWASEAVSYNALAVAWPEIARLASSQKTKGGTQKELFE